MQPIDSPSITLFNPQKVSFGRHETFALRYSWLTKGFQTLLKNSKVFSSDEATVTLGLYAVQHNLDRDACSQVVIFKSNECSCA